MKGAELPIRCECGSLRGVLHGAGPSVGTRLVCYCDDCQAFAAYLGRGTQVLDAHGGTDIFQVSPARLELVAGLEHVACLRLTPRGIFRWYAACCNTPIGNTLPTGRIPFVGLIHACMDAGGRSLDDVLGPVRAGVNGRYATGDRTAVVAHDSFSPLLAMRVFLRILGWWLRRDHLRSPFFRRDGTPIATPHTS